MLKEERVCREITVSELIRLLQDEDNDPETTIIKVANDEEGNWCGDIGRLELNEALGSDKVKILIIYPNH